MALDKFRNTTIRWDKAARKIHESLRVSSGDENGRKLTVQVVDGGEVADLTGATLSLYWETRNKAHNGLDAFDPTNAAQGEFEIYYTTGMLSNVGILDAKLVLVDSTGRVVSEPFKVTVFGGIDDEAIESENSFTALTQALAKVENVEANYTPRLSTIEQNQDSLQAQLAETEQDLTAQLQQKATKEEVAIKVSQIVSGSPKGTYLTLSALQTAHPTGDTGIYIVSADGNWYYWNGNAWNAGGVYQSTGIADNSITEEKTDMLSTNLFDRNTAPNGFYTLGLNFYDNGSTSFSSQKVAISKGDIIKLNFKTTGPHHLQFFDANEVIKKVTPYTAPSVDHSFYLKIDNDYKYFSVAFTKSSGGASNDTLKSVYKVKGTQALSLLTEKKIKEVVTAEFLSPFIPESGGGSPTIGVDSFYSNENYNAIGDSITQGYLGSANGGYMERPYPTVVKELVGFANARNYGISGTCIASGYGAKPTQGMVDRYSLMDNDAHVISVLGGVNDRDQNVPLGTFGSTDKTNFYGALKILVEGLINKYPSKVIFLMTPLSRGLEAANTAGHKLNDYAQAIRVVGAYYGLPVLDLHATSNFFPYITANKDANSMDGLHPNQAYVENILARKIAGFIKTIA